MTLRLAIPAFLVVALATVAPAGAQGIESEGIAITEAVILFMAEQHQLSMDQLFVDTVRTGRIRSPKPFEHRQRVVPVARMRGLANRLGFRLVETPAILDCFTFPHEDQGRCRLPDPGLGLTIHAAEVSGREASVPVVYYLLRSNLPVGGGESGVVRIELQRLDREWRITNATVETRGHHRRVPQ